VKATWRAFILRNKFACSHFKNKYFQIKDDVSEIHLIGAPKTWAQFPIELGNEVRQMGTTKHIYERLHEKTGHSKLES
jgi:hypothetical protein